MMSINRRRQHPWVWTDFSNQCNLRRNRNSSSLSFKRCKLNSLKFKMSTEKWFKSLLNRLPIQWKLWIWVKAPFWGRQQAINQRRRNEKGNPRIKTPPQNPRKLRQFSRQRKIQMRLQKRRYQRRVLDKKGKTRLNKKAKNSTIVHHRQNP